MGLFSFFKKKENIDPMEARKAFLLEHGRITDGRIIDSIQKSSGEEGVFYIYIHLTVLTSNRLRY